MSSQAAPVPDTPTVLATVLTYNAPRALVQCLEHIANQSRRPDSVVVVDNASVQPAEEVIRSAGLSLPSIRIVRQAQNGGPAGGHAAGLREFVSSAFDLAWVMDDDCVPEEKCLEELLKVAVRKRDAAFVFPMWVQPDGSVTQYPAWCGFLIGRDIVRKVGLPLEELFWWAEDTEYLFWRIPQAGYAMVHTHSAVVRHTEVRHVHGNPPWKYYYESRNNVYLHVHVMQNVRRLPKKLALTVGRALIREEQGRAVRLLMTARGVADGFRGRLGKRVEVEAGWGAQGSTAPAPQPGVAQ